MRFQRLSRFARLIAPLLVVVGAVALFFFWMGADVLAQGEGIPTGRLGTPQEVSGIAGVQYDKGITVGDGDLVSLVITVTNYLLGFVAMVAMVAIIYAGFLYVVNFGNQELTGKAKTILLYTALGVIVIILSYALVTALLGVALPQMGDKCSVASENCVAPLQCVEFDPINSPGDGVCKDVLNESSGTLVVCSANKPCASGLQCVIEKDETSGFCRLLTGKNEFSVCDPADNECDIHLICYDPEDVGSGLCRKPSDLGAGDPCDLVPGSTSLESSACKKGFWCVDVNGDNKGVCTYPRGSLLSCTNECPVGETCLGNVCLDLRDPTQTSTSGGNTGIPQAQDIVQQVILAFKRLGDVCPSTTIGLQVDASGCSANQFLTDTDADGIVNVIDMDDDNDGTPDDRDTDIDGDTVPDSQDKCPDTLSFRAFQLTSLEKNKIASERTTQDQYNASINNPSFPGCALYQATPDIDGDTVPDFADCDADGDGLLDNKTCLQVYADFIATNSAAVDALMPQQGVTVSIVSEDEDSDDDDDGVVDFGSSDSQTSKEQALLTLSQSFEQLRRTIYLTCARLPKTTEVLSFCAIEDVQQSGIAEPVGSLVQMLARLTGTKINLPEWEEFRRLYLQFQQMVRYFPKVEASFASDVVSSELPVSGAPLPVNFDASRTTDPYQEACPVDDTDYYWFINESIDWSAGLDALLDAQRYVGQGVFFRHDFDTAGVYNIQLLVRSSCTLGEVVPNTETGSVDAAMAGLTSLKIRVLPPRAQLVALVNGGQTDRGFAPVDVLAEDFVKVSFDLRQSSTNRGPFTQLSYSCEGAESKTITAPQNYWTFDCTWNSPSGRKKVQFFAQDRDGRIERSIDLVFKNVVAVIDTSPATLQGTVETEFTFDGSRSKARGGTITNWNWEIKRQSSLVGPFLEDIASYSDGSVFVYTFDEDNPGTFTVSLTVSVGSGAPATTSVLVTVVPRDPVPIFTAVFSDPLLPGRVFMDASASYYPDDPHNSSQLGYKWVVDGVILHRKTGLDDPGPFYELQGTGDTGATSGVDPFVFYDFSKRGTHKVALTVRVGEREATLERELPVPSVLGVDFDASPRAAHAGDTVRFTPRSPRAVGYFWDFGDDFTLVADSSSVSHKYDEQGEYPVKLEVEDNNGDTNSVTKTVRVGLANQPLSVIQALVRGKEMIPRGTICNNRGIEVTRRDSLVLSGSHSINVSGDSVGLEYLWQIGDDVRARGATTSVRFDELTTTKCENVGLTVTDEVTGENNRSYINISVVNIAPELSDVRILPPQRDVTPVTVPVQAIGDRDADGRINEYKWWYYAEGKEVEKLDTHVTQMNSTRFVVGPRGIEGQKIRYFFVVEMTDNDGKTVNSENLVGRSQGLTVVNGPNIVPIAEYTVDKTVVKVGERVVFTSTTKDPLGEYIPTGAYQWDFEGDGKFEKGVNGPKVSFAFPGPGAFHPLLRVVKNGLSTAYDMKIEVMPDTVKPEAAFLFVKSGSKVTFINNSIVDSSLKDKDIRYSWDFDASVDTDGNGDPDDDADSALPNPLFEFKGDKDVEVRLQVTDAMNLTDDVRRTVEFVVKPDRGPLGATVSSVLKPVLMVTPERNPVDGKVYIRPPVADVIFNARKSSGKIQEYRIDTNLFVDSDGDGVTDNDIDNKTDPSWKDGTNFKQRYRIEDGRIRAGLLVVDASGAKKGVALDIVFSRDDMTQVLQQRLQDPDQALTVLSTIPVVSFDVVYPGGQSEGFAQPNQKLVFDASRTRFPDEKVKEFLWDFNGDGLVDELSFEPKFTHAFPQAGVYSVILEATSDGGLTGDYSQTVIVRGGFELPKAAFRSEKEGQTVRFFNESTFDPSFSEDDIAYQWTFSRFDLSVLPEWVDWEKKSEYVIADESLGLAPLHVRVSLSWNEYSDFAGALPRRIALGESPVVALFEDGELLFQGEEALPFSGSLRFLKLDSSPDAFAEYDTGVDPFVRLDKGVTFVVDEVLEKAELTMVLPSDPEQVVVVQGELKNDRTLFFSRQFGGRVRIAGTLRQSAADASVLGLSSVPNPVKVFSEQGSYKVVLLLTDGVGEKSETQEILQLTVQDFTVPKAEVPVEVGIEAPPAIVDEAEIGESPSETPSVPTPTLRVAPSEGLPWVKIILGLVMILVGGVVAVLFIQIIRRRVSEVTEKISSDRQKTAPPVVEAEVVEKTPSSEKPKEVPVASEKEAPKVPSPPPPVPKKEEPKKEDASSKDGDGPIPDWLKQ